MSQVHLQGRPRDDAGIPEQATNGCVPGHVGDARGPFEEVATRAVLRRSNPELSQEESLLGCDRDALAERRVEAGGRVSQREQAVGKAAQALVAAANARREAEGGWLAERLRVAQDLGQLRAGQRSRELDEPGVIARRARS